METVLAFVIGGALCGRVVHDAASQRGEADHRHQSVGACGEPADFYHRRIDPGAAAAHYRVRPTHCGAFADPMPQALILTAIVIGFAVQAFAVVLIHRVIQTVGTDDLDQMKATDT